MQRGTHFLQKACICLCIYVTLHCYSVYFFQSTFAFCNTYKVQMRWENSIQNSIQNGKFLGWKKLSKHLRNLGIFTSNKRTLKMDQNQCSGFAWDLLCPFPPLSRIKKVRWGLNALKKSSKNSAAAVACSSYG